jgi:disulfide bond formation protein DsbB
MFNKIVNQLHIISLSSRYWGFLITASLLMIIVALVYQYVFDEWPCVLCIHIRLWVSLLIITSFAGLLIRKHPLWGVLANISTALLATALTERSYMLLGTERGFVFGDCGFSVGLPDWFAVEQWVPWLYGVESSCGYTPELVFGITMAEALMLMFVALLFVSWGIVLAIFIKKYRGYKAS